MSTMAFTEVSYFFILKKWEDVFFLFEEKSQERGMGTLHDIYANSFLLVSHSFGFYNLDSQTYVCTYGTYIHFCHIFAYTPIVPQSILCHQLAQEALLRILTLAYIVTMIHSPLVHYKH